MQITVEFTGIARTIVQNSQELFEMPAHTTIQEVIHVLALKFPGLKNIIIAENGESLLNSNVFILNGDEMVLPDSLNLKLTNGDRLTLLSVIVGG